MFFLQILHFPSHGSILISSLLSAGGSDPCYCSFCTYIIAVVCAVGTRCSYSLVVSQAALTQLSDGRPLAGQVAAQSYRYFSFNARAFDIAGGSNLTFSVTTPSFSVGAAQIYVSNAGDPLLLPTDVPSTYQWSSPLYGALYGTVNVVLGDPLLRQCGRPNCSSTFIIGMRSRTNDPLGFSILARSVVATQSLIPGVPSAVTTLVSV